MKTLNVLARDAWETVESGYYNEDPKLWSKSPIGLVHAIKERMGNAIVCEIKFASPSAGEIRNYGEAFQIAKDMEDGGATGLSILTEPKNFNGSIQNFVDARRHSNLPIIMKDIVVSKKQIVSASQIGASAILFIEEVFSDGLTMDRLSLDAAVKTAAKLGLDTIIETHTQEGLGKVSKTKCDIIGINNRDLRTFKTDIDTTVQLLSTLPIEATRNRLIMSESGFEDPEDIKKLRMKLEGLAFPNAFLIGTSIMKSQDIKSKVRSFVEA